MPFIFMSFQIYVRFLFMCCKVSTTKYTLATNGKLEVTLLYFILGFYCPEGTEKAVMCPENTVRNYSGGASAQDCLTCPTRHWCQAGIYAYYQLQNVAVL